MGTLSTNTNQALVYIFSYKNKMVLKLLHSGLDPITEIPNSIEDFLQKYIKKSQSDTFTSQSKRSIKEDVIYVGQREVAILNPNQNFGLQYIGSEDATTCHIITMRNPQSMQELQ